MEVRVLLLRLSTGEQGLLSGTGRCRSLFAFSFLRIPYYIYLEYENAPGSLGYKYCMRINEDYMEIIDRDDIANDSGLTMDVKQNV